MEESEAVPAKRAKKDSRITSAVPRSRKQSRSAIDLEQQGSIEDVVTSKAFNRESPVISNQKSEPAEYIPMLCDQSSLNDLSSIYNSSLADSMMQQSPKPCAQVPQVEIPQSISSLDQNSDMDGLVAQFGHFFLTFFLRVFDGRFYLFSFRFSLFARSFLNIFWC